MAYTLNRYNRSILTTVDEGTIDRTTDLQFVGKNYAGYGEIQNENFLYLLENFSGANSPAKALDGQLWYDTTTKKIRLYDGTSWRKLAVTTDNATEPSNAVLGDFWWDTNKGQLYAYNGTAHELIGPEKAGTGVTRMVSTEVLDDAGNTHSIIKATVDNDVLFVFSTDTFTLDNAENPITGFADIKSGVTLINSSNASGVTSSAHRYWGSASNAEKLDDLDSTQFLRSDVDTTLTGEFNFANDNTGVNWASNTITIKGSAADAKLELATRSNDETVFKAGAAETLKIDPTANTLGLTYLGNTVWHAGNHGSGSGLNADLLDGFDHTDFLKVNAKAVDSNLLDGLDSTAFLQRTGGIMTGNIEFSDSNEGLRFAPNSDTATIRYINGGVGDTDARLEFQTQNNDYNAFRWTHNPTGTTVVELMKLVNNNTANGLTYRGNTVWHAGNDGAGTGMDADTVDGLHAADFLPVNGKAVNSALADFATNADTVDGKHASEFLPVNGNAVSATLATTAVNANNADKLDNYNHTDFVKTAGQTMTGFLTLHSEPSSPMHAATKSYVDYKVGNVDPYWAGQTTFAAVKSTYSAFPINTRVSFWEFGVGTVTSSNGGSFTFTDRYRRTVKKIGTNNWIDIGG
jgi:hypothetical protein